MMKRAKGAMGMFDVLSSLLKYIFITLIYLFIYGIIRLIYLDIKSMNAPAAVPEVHWPSIKLLTPKSQLHFKVADEYTLEKAMTMGRLKSNDIIIEDPFISGQHVRFFLDNGECWVEDLGSTNGTLVNGREIGEDEPVPLEDGDQIHIGQMDFLYKE